MPKTTVTDPDAIVTRIGSLHAEHVAAWVAHNLPDPDDQAAVVALSAQWQAKDSIARLERARQLAHQARRARAQAERAVDPDYWALVARRVGWTSVRSVWPAAPVPADWAVNPASGWSIYENGAYVTTPVGGRQWVCSPSVCTPTGIAVLHDGQWNVVGKGKLEDRLKDRLEDRHDPGITAITAARAAGLTWADGVVVGPDRDNSETVPGARMARWWLLGIGLDEGIGKHPCGSFQNIWATDRLEQSLAFGSFDDRMQQSDHWARKNQPGRMRKG